MGRVIEPRYLRKFDVSADQARLLEHHLRLCDHLVAEIEADFPASRERSIAIIRLDELVYWLTRAAVA